MTALASAVNWRYSRSQEARGSCERLDRARDFSCSLRPGQRLSSETVARIEATRWQVETGRRETRGCWPETGAASYATKSMQRHGPRPTTGAFLRVRSVRGRTTGHRAQHRPSSDADERARTRVVPDVADDEADGGEDEEPRDGSADSSETSGGGGADDGRLRLCDSPVVGADAHGGTQHGSVRHGWTEGARTRGLETLALLTSDDGRLVLLHHLRDERLRELSVP